MKHTKLLVVALLVALIACLAMSASADPCLHPTRQQLVQFAPTCVTSGVGIVQCLTCGTTIDTYVIPATGIHTYGTPVEVAPTCGEAGCVKRTCTVCGYTDVYQTIPATNNHTWTTYAAAVAPTCTTNGTKEWKICSVCGKLKTAAPEVDPAPGHDVDGQPWDVIVQEANCAQIGILGRRCRVCLAVVETKNTPKGNHDAGWYTYDKTTTTQGSGYTLPYKAPYCTTTGCTAVYQCSICGALKGGETIEALGHDLNGVVWTVKTKATCATAGVLERKCNRCGQSVETQNVGKTSYHSDANGVANDYNNAKTNVAADGFTLSLANNGSLQPIIPFKQGDCTTDGCKAVWQCPTCGATKGGEKVTAPGHKIPEANWAWKNGNPANCTTAGVREGTCSVCGKVGASVTVPAYGHSAVWQIQTVATPTSTGMAILKCTRCGQTIGMQILNYGDKLPSGSVNTGNAAKSTSTAKSTTTTKKTSTAKTTKTTTTAAAPAAATTKTATVVAAAAPAALPTNAAALKADTSLYIVKNVADEDIVLSVEVKDGKITVTADLAEGESLVLYANEDAIANPTAENTLVLTANEAVELPAEFANAILAVVKTESLPAAVAAK